MTAQHLLAELERFGCFPRVEGCELVFDADIPEHLAKPLEVLHTGLRAVLIGRRWYGVDLATGHPTGPDPLADGPLAFGALDPAQRLPGNTGLLSVEGDPSWDRLPSWARDECPELFGPAVTRKTRYQPRRYRAYQRSA